MLAKSNPFLWAIIFLLIIPLTSLAKNNGIEERLNNIEAKLNDFSLQGFKTTSEMRVRHQHRTNTPSPNRNDLSNFYDMRVRLRFEYNATPDLGLVFTPQMSKNFGNGTPNDGNRNEGEASSNNLADLDLLESYLRYKALDNLELRFGRQALKYGDGLIINNPVFNNTGRVFDAIKGSLKHRLGKIDLFYSRINDGESDTNISGGRTENDTDFIGFYNNLSLMNVDEIDFYLLGYLDRGSSTNQYGKLADEIQEVYSFGFRLKDKINNWRFLTELISQKGSNQLSNKSNLGLLEIGYMLNKKWSLWFEGMHIQKDYRPFYTSRHKYLGHLDIFGIRNINSVRLRTKYKYSDKTKFMIDLYKFARNDDKSPVFNNVISKEIGSSLGLDGEDDLGHEIDFKFDTNLQKALGLTSGYAYYTPGKYFERQNLDIDAHYFYTELKYKF